MAKNKRPLKNTPLDALSLEEKDRPKAPPMKGLSKHQLQTGKQLEYIHRQHRMELSRARAVFRHVAEGKENPAVFLQQLKDMDMSQNYRLFGNLCGRECQMLNFHHDAEEHFTFPHLARNGSEGLRKVIAKLQREHEVVHELLLRLEDAAYELTDNPSTEKFEHAAAVFDKLDKVIMSHFGYEEDELQEAIGKFGMGH